MANDATKEAPGTVQVGPDLNASRSPLDKKLYRHITLPNGLQAVLIQDTIAMQQLAQSGGDDEADESDDEDDDDNPDDVPSTTERPPRNHGPRSSVNDDDDDENGGHDDDDEDTDNVVRNAACCIVVGAGSVSDPPHCPGLAHFLEHLLFMGSTKYPGENEYPSFVAKHGGSDPAWTEWEYTAYGFDVTASSYALWGALDRLAQFFVAPLLLENAVDRELQSIEAEFQLQKNKDSTRRQQLICSMCRPDHPIAKFSWGSLRSLSEIPAALGIDVMQELRTFYNQHYYAENMRLVIQGAYTLDELQEKVVQCFSPVPAHPRDGSPSNRQVQAMQAAGLPFRPEIPGTITRIVPVRERHELVITWQIPCQFAHWRSKPVEFLSHLLGHEASGSLLSWARSQSWATACMAGGNDEGSEAATSHALFSLSFTLSEAGLEHWPDLVHAVYEYIGLLRKQCRDGWPSWIYEELRSVGELSYRYGDEASPDETVTALAEQMAPYYNMPVERLLDGGDLLFEFDETTIQSLLDDCLKPELARYDLTSSSFGKPTDFETVALADHATETIVLSLNITNDNEDGSFDVGAAGNPQVEPMFGTQFWCRRLPQVWLDKLTLASEPGIPNIEMLSLPPRNPFIPQNLELKPLPAEDADHPLLNAALKLCIAVGKTKQWFPATVVQYNPKTISVRLSFEDEEEKWHVLDDDASVFTDEVLLRSDSFEGTMDAKTIKYRIVALCLHPGAKGAGIRKFGDDCDLDVEDGISFPPIPPPSTRIPVQISNTNALKMWWLQDRKFKRPTGEFCIQVICANANASPLHRACLDLMENVCSDALLETAYLAEMYDLNSELEASDIGFNLQFSGYNDKLLDLFQTTMQVLLGFRKGTHSVNPDRFPICLEILRRSYKNSGMSSSKLASNVRLRAIRPTIHSASQKMAALEGITLEKFHEVATSILESYAMEALLHGNFDHADAVQARDLLNGMLVEAGGAGLARKKYPPQSVLRIPTVDKASHIMLPSKDPEEPNTTCEVYIQVGKDNLQDRVMMDLLMHMINEPLFDQIRTKDQFGYDVYCDVRWSYGIIGCIFGVTTNSKSAADVIQRIDSFLTQFRQDIVDMEQDDFQEHVVGLAKQKLTMFDSLSDETSCLWGEIYDGRFEWEAWREETICLRGISKTNVLKAYDDWLLPGQPRNILTVQVIGAVDTPISLGRPAVQAHDFSSFVDEQVSTFHQCCKQQTWGRVNSKLF
jgi:secreted Zn-dependent insulinase-like peptidase